MLLFDNGNIIARGQHHELVHGFGPYAHLMRSFNSLTGVGRSNHSTPKTPGPSSRAFTLSCSDTTTAPPFPEAPTSSPAIVCTSATTSQQTAHSRDEFSTGNDSDSAPPSSSSPSSSSMLADGDVLDIWMTQSASLSQEFATRTTIRLSYDVVAHSADPSLAFSRELFIRATDKQSSLLPPSPSMPTTQQDFQIAKTRGARTPSFFQIGLHPLTPHHPSIVVTPHHPADQRKTLFLLPNPISSGIDRRSMWQLSLPVLTSGDDQVGMADLSRSYPAVFSQGWDHPSHTSLSTIEDADVREGKV